jgi:hypothetical protein
LGSIKLLNHDQRTSDKKGSLYLKTYVETVIKAALGRECKSIVTEESIVVEFQE